jgi:hypothetical protein
LAAEFVERPDTVFVNLAFAVETQFLLNLDLNGKSMGVPAAPADDMLAQHGMVTREDIFKRPGENMVNPWYAIRGWWTFVENIFWVSTPLFFALCEDVADLPHAQDRFFHLGDIKFG